MLLRKLRLVNYGGIYNGLGLFDINIDFTRCKNRIIVVRGDNGSGKSTIVGSLKPLPEDNSYFIQGKTAIKEIEYFDEFNNIIYAIRFIHECKNDGSRATAKGYIQKIIINTNEVTELNPSGNISSCKDIIFEEFQLDPNYVTLIQLSNAKRGLADMRPADRKRYTNSILTNTTAYNDMHKTLSKKALSYKSLMNTIVSKLNSIGDIGQLQSKLMNIQSEISTLSTMNSNALNNRASAEGSLREIDPTREVFTLISENTRIIEELEKSLNAIGDSVDGCTEESLNKGIVEIEALISRCDTNIESFRRASEDILAQRETDSAELQAKSQKLSNLNSGESIEQCDKLIDDYKKRIMVIQQRWGNMVSLNNITRDEVIMLIETLQGIQRAVDNFKVSYTISVVKHVWNMYNGGMIYNTDAVKDGHKVCINSVDEAKSIYQSLKQGLETEQSKLEEYKKELSRIESMETLLGALDNRPDGCNIDTCPFITRALEARKCVDNTDKQAIVDNITNSEETIRECLSVMNDIENIISIADNGLRPLAESFSRVTRIINKINFNGFKDKAMDFGWVLMNMLDNNNMDDTIFGRIYRMLDYTNDIEEYKVLIDNLNDVKSKRKALSSQEDFIRTLMDDIDRLNAQLDKDQQKLDDINHNITVEEETRSQACKCRDALRYKLKVLKEKNEMVARLEEARSTLDKNKDKVEKIREYTSIIDEANNIIAFSDDKLKPLMAERDRLNYQINLAGQYKTELAEYEAMHQKIETLKHYSSPTTGIQLLFASIYLNKILDNANTLIQNLFRGQFALLPFIINESEFRIPVAVNGGINHDDITNMSSAQIALISMIISISLLSQTSTRLNIIVGDEIDAPFDSENRREFSLNILPELMNLVNSSQCVLISHNSEIMLRDCDIIALRMDTDKESINEGNIIWNYNSL